MMRALPLCLLMLAVCAPTAPGQEEDPQAEMRRQLEEFNKISRQIQDRVREAREKGNRLTELEALRTLEKEFADKGFMAKQAIDLQLMGIEIELGGYAKALEIADRSGGPRSAGKPPEEALAGHSPVDALERIVELADTAQIVIINEAHHVPQHRAFTHRLLRALREKGFTYFAAETLSARDTKLEERGYPVQATGAYTPEPVYADVVRTALALGYHAVPYEAVFGSRDRELDQATNLMKRIFENDPEAKALIHVGYAHAHESGLLAGVSPMAVRLRELTGVDPLTIDQTVMTEHGSPRFDHATYRYALEKHAFTEPVIFRDTNGKDFANDPALTDLTIFSPRSVYVNGRPTWLSLGGIRKPWTLPAEAREHGKHALVRARPASEPAEAIPVDQIELTPGKDAPALMLPAGSIVIEVVDAANETLWTSTVEIR